MFPRRWVALLVACGLLLVLTQAVWAEPAAPGIFARRAFLPLVDGQQATGAGVSPHGWEVQSSIDYVVQPDDTLASIAIEFGRDLTDMACATRSASEDPSAIRPGQKLAIPALGTACHIVRRGETLDSIASLYGVPVEVIVDNAWNELDGPPYVLHPGQRLRIRGALDPRFMSSYRPLKRHRIPSRVADNGLPLEEWPYGDGHFVWPVKGPITQRFSAHHRAIDIAADFGEVVVAADTGTVVRAGWNNQGLGYRVVIDHHINYVTVYAHLSAILVREGEVVKKGQPIGLIGSTGHSTGPHLHFVIRDYGVAVDPLTLLPPQ
ncbi:MAG: M23 family metallopeptidase [Anaerolineae bacterium]|nr:M23 family metallopeptidase [Anaerolineae bacterium]